MLINNISKRSMENTKPLFLPLYTKYYEAFECGEKTDELRLYGPRWNERTCRVGRDVVLSKGYGKKHRMKGKICGFEHSYGFILNDNYQAAILDCYGREALDEDIAVIGIEILK